ncbi:ribosome rescue protein RqcH [Infirmifilum sp. NZ]|uniref:ribosome rescue protein RqcH n=1 Tax=Infirmifilum sp. NZ TaxID=2926850 RepID=UPI0027AA365C|nr:ribosome rescue protein RqcH [Infirmifilum sp. NZ]UNQ72800.1 NFACT family protein [Infirmifilum sp. NZ]
MSVATSRRSVSLLDVYKIWDLFAGLEGSRLAKALLRGELAVLQFSSGVLLFHPRRGPCPAPGDVELTAPQRLKQLGDLEGRRVTAVSVVNDDRVLALDFHGFTLVLEWVREGNIILLDGEGKILYAYRQKSMRDRSVKRGEAYTPPPKLADASEHPLVVAEKALALGRRSLVTALSQASSLPPEVVYEAAFRLGVDPSSAPGSVGEAVRVLEKAREIFVEALEDKRGGYVVESGSRRAVYPFNPLHLSDRAFRVDFPAEFPRYMAESLLAEEHAPESSPAEKALEALRSLEAAARLVLDNAPRIQGVLEHYRALREQGLSWRSIEEAVRSAHPEVKSIDHERWSIVVSIGGVDVEVDARRSAYANAESLFEKAKSLKARIPQLAAKPEEPVRVRVSPKGGGREPWYRDFRFFYTTNGFLVVAGKSAGQNELLVRRYMEDRDIFLHADIHGAPATVLKTGGREVPEKDIYEAAQFAACYSSAWRAGLAAIDVFWVPASQVSKSPPSGEYLGKGAFMIYGKRNWIRGVPLELLVGYDGSNVVALPASRSPQGGCFLKLTPGPLSRELTSRKIADFLLRECRVKVKVADILKLLPSGTFHVERWVRVGRAWPHLPPSPF